jgi:hypothetical protein
MLKEKAISLVNASLTIKAGLVINRWTKPDRLVAI